MNMKTSSSSSKGPIVILLEHRLDYRAIYGMNLTLYLGLEVKVANTIREVILLIENEDVGLVFVNNTAYSQDVGGELWRSFESRMIRIPLFIVGKAQVPQDEVTLFDSKIDIKSILKSVAKTMSITAKSMFEKTYPKYFPLPMEFVVPGWQTNVEIFIQKDDKYQALFIEGDIILQDTLDELEESEYGEDFQIYVDRDKRLKFVNSLTHQISAKLNDPLLSSEERHQVTATGFQMVMEQARSIGVGESTLEIANDCIESMNLIVNEISSLDSLLDNLMNSQDSYRYKHSLLIHYIGTHIIKKVPWGNKEHQKIFSYVSFFHDISLSKDEYAVIHSDKTLKNSSFTEREESLIRNHALMSAKLVAGVEGIPLGVDVIIKQHHGSIKGVGLSKLGLELKPLSIVFIFAEEWACYSLKSEKAAKRPEKIAVIRHLHNKYNHPGFNKILPILHSLDI